MKTKQYSIALRVFSAKVPVIEEGHSEVFKSAVRQSITLTGISSGYTKTYQPVEPLGDAEDEAPYVVLEAPKDALIYNRNGKLLAKPIPVTYTPIDDHLELPLEALIGLPEGFYEFSVGEQLQPLKAQLITSNEAFYLNGVTKKAVIPPYSNDKPTLTEDCLNPFNPSMIDDRRFVLYKLEGTSYTAKAVLSKASGTDLPDELQKLVESHQEFWRDWYLLPERIALRANGELLEAFLESFPDNLPTYKVT